jgi:predicted nucleotidyltransferase
MKSDTSPLLHSRLHALWAAYAELEFAVLVGSRATGEFRPDSDWDIAIRWQRELSAYRRLELTESLRLDVARSLDVEPEQVDLIDLAVARLAMRAQVAERGRVLYGAESLPWLRFLQTTWAQIEDFDWRRRHAA